MLGPVMGMTGHFRAVSPETLAEIFAAPGSVHALLESPGGRGDHLALERAWHGLHFLMCGSPWEGTPPLDFIMNGGEPIGDEDVGEGPARGFSAEEVRRIAIALGAVTWPALWARWDAEAIRAAKLYRVDPDASDTESAYLEVAFQWLRAFITGLAQKNQAMLVYMRSSSPTR